MATDFILPSDSLHAGFDLKPLPYKERIAGAILFIKDRNGLSLASIKKLLNATSGQHRFIRAALRKGVESGYFVKNKGKYKLSNWAKQPKKKKRKRKKKAKKRRKKKVPKETVAENPTFEEQLKPKKTRRKKGPTFKDQIKGAILGLRDRSGSSLPAIKKWLNATTPPQYRYINDALRKGVDSGYFIKNGGKYRLGPEAKQPKKKIMRTCVFEKEDRLEYGIRDPPGSRCRPGPRTPCEPEEKYLKRRRLSKTRTKQGGRRYECVTRKRSRRKSTKR